MDDDDWGFVTRFVVDLDDADQQWAAVFAAIDATSESSSLAMLAAFIVESLIEDAYAEGTLERRLTAHMDDPSLRRVLRGCMVSTRADEVVSRLLGRA